MPKPKEDPGYSEQEMRDWLKSRGYDVDTPGGKAPATKTPDTNTPANAGSASAASPGTAAPSAGSFEDAQRTFAESPWTSWIGANTPTPGRAPTYEEMGWQSRAGQGAMREMARMGVGAGRLIGKLSPSLGDYAERVPGVKRMEDFAAHDVEGPMEYLGQGATDIAMAGLTPALRLGNLAGAAVTRTMPTWVNPLGAGGQWMRGVTNPGVVKGAKAAGNFAENVGKGAVGGAVTDPEDPKTGAEYGGAASATTQAVGRALRSGPGQHLVGSLIRYIPAGAAYALLHKLGHEIAGELAAGAMAARTFAHGVAHDIRGYSTPVGRYLRGVGEAGAGKTGQFMQRNLPAGIEAGKAAKEYSPQQGLDAASEWYDRTTTPPPQAPRRSIYQEQEREEE